MNRKQFVTLAGLGTAAVVTGGITGCANSVLASPMSTTNRASKAVYVPRGKDRFKEELMIWGVIPLQIKISTKDSGGALFAFEHDKMGKGGPPRHLHYEQDEWFYAIEGEFHFEVGDEKFVLRPGDSLFAPRMVPHVWAHVGNKPGNILIAVQPAGTFEEFFMKTTKMKAPPSPQEVEEQFAAHGMKVVGPPLPFYNSACRKRSINLYV